MCWMQDEDKVGSWETRMGEMKEGGAVLILCVV